MFVAHDDVGAESNSAICCVETEAFQRAYIDYSEEFKGSVVMMIYSESHVEDFCVHV